MENPDIRVKSLNASFCVIETNSSISQEIREKFTFKVPHAKYDWRYKKRLWDGNIHLFNGRTLYVGLIDKLKEFARKKGYSLYSEYDDHSEVKQYYPSSEDLEIFYGNNLLESMKYAKDQIDLFSQAVNEKRATVIAPTGSGKSFLIYLLSKFWNGKTLIICPTINLVNQTKSNFDEYDSSFMEEYVVDVVTWQSLQNKEPEFFHQYETVIVDECHGAKAKVLKTIMEHCVNAHHRYGFTGTTDDIPVNELVLEGLFGKFLKNRTTMELVDEGRLAKPKVKCILLEYPEEERKHLHEEMRKFKKDDGAKAYNFETKFLTEHQDRQKILNDIISAINGSSFVLFRNISHGEQIYNTLSKVRACELVYGITDGDKREEVRIQANRDSNSCVVASYGVFSTGVDVPELRNVVFASPYKSKIKVLQSIGRVVRKTAGKNDVFVWDVVDDLSVGKRMNYAVKHFVERCKLYEKEKFDYEIIRLKVSGKETKLL